MPDDREVLVEEFRKVQRAVALFQKVRHDGWSELCTLNEIIGKLCRCEEPLQRAVHMYWDADPDLVGAETLSHMFRDPRSMLPWPPSEQLEELEEFDAIDAEFRCHLPPGLEARIDLAPRAVQRALLEEWLASLPEHYVSVHRLAREMNGRQYWARVHAARIVERELGISLLDPVSGHIDEQAVLEWCDSLQQQ